ncbi:MAG TPA: BBE domain-containing protein, partial [Ktedonobacterales bacterium]
LQNYWKAHFVKELPDAAIEAHVKYGALVPSIQSGMHLYPITGAVHRVGQDETAFPYRDAGWVANIVAIYPDATDTPQNVRWVREYWEALRPYSLPGTYINFLGDEGKDRIKDSYGRSYARLVAVKEKYDPTNLFHMNQNIVPGGAKPGNGKAGDGKAGNGKAGNGKAGNGKAGNGKAGRAKPGDGRSAGPAR